MYIEKGIYTALVTPFENGKIHRPSLIKLVEDQLSKGVDGFVVLGTTGETPSLNVEEKKQIFDIVKEIASVKVPLIVGTGSNNTQQTIHDSRQALDWGAEAVLVVTPYYNKPPQRGLLSHFQEVAENVDGPIILYDVPGRTGVSLEERTVSELASISNIIGIKDATGEMSRVEPSLRNDSFLVFSGDDGTFLPFLQRGGHGAISVLSHILPEQMKSWCDRPSDDQSEEEFKRSQRLIKSLFIEANPIPVKMALYLMGIISTPDMRLPLVTLDPSYVDLLKESLKSWGKLA